MNSKKIAKTLVLSALAVCTMTAFASAAEGDIAVAVGCTNGTSLNLRKANSTSAEVITQLDKSLAVSILDMTDPDWYRINYNGSVGYVASQYLTVDQDNVFNTFGRVCASTVNVRADATTDSVAVKQLSMGTIVPVTGMTDGWFSVRLEDESIGYIRSDFLDLVKDSTVTAAASGNGSAAVDLAVRHLGTKYVYGGAAPGAFDCSGFTMYVFKQFGISLPHTASGQWTGGYGAKITARDQLQPGDLVFFNDPSRSGGKACSHAGIYVGNGTFIHASSGKSGVVYSSLNDAYYNRYYIGGIRVL